jgi:hypothetical protein
VRERTFIAAALVTGIWAAACSKPGSEASRTLRQSADSARVNLVSTPAPDAPVVSNLEAGRDPRLALPRPLVRKPAELPVRGSGGATVAQANGEAAHAHAAAALVPTMRVTTTSLASVAPDVAPSVLPLAAATGGHAIGSDGSEGSSEGSARLPSVVSRGPAIIIRGGMGSARDDCDLHRRPGFGAFGGGGGAAVNRMAPSPGRSMGGPMSANPSGLRIR